MSVGMGSVHGGREGDTKVGGPLEKGEDIGKGNHEGCPYGGIRRFVVGLWLFHWRGFVEALSALIGLQSAPVPVGDFGCQRCAASGFASSFSLS